MSSSKPPRLPFSHPLVGLRTLSINSESYIWALLQEAGAKEPALTPNRVDAEDDEIFRSEGFFAQLDSEIARIVSIYLTTRYFELAEPNYAHFLRDLKEVQPVIASLGQLPPITSSLWPAIDEKAGEGTTDQLFELIRLISEAIHDLAKEEGIGKRSGAPAKRAKHQLLGQLAGLFHRYTQQAPVPGSSVFGFFEDFVAEVEQVAMAWLKLRIKGMANPNNSIPSVEDYWFARGVDASLRKSK